MPSQRSSVYRARTLLAALGSLGLLGCAGYSFDINENEIYTPPRIYTNFTTSDPALEACLKQTIRDRKITDPTQLETLHCSHSGIESIEGISQFSRLRQISFKGNGIVEIDALLQLTYLEYLDLSDNPTTDCQTLDQLEELVTDNLVHTATCP